MTTNSPAAILALGMGEFDTVRTPWRDLDASPHHGSTGRARADWLRLRGLRYVAPRWFEARLDEPMAQLFEGYEVSGAGSGEAMPRSDARVAVEPLMPGVFDLDEMPAILTAWVASVRMQGRVSDWALVAAAALRAEAIRVETGAWPEAEALGVDRYGRAYRVRVLTDGWWVYTTGPDGLDTAGYGRHAGSHDPLPSDDAGGAVSDAVRDAVEAADGRVRDTWDDRAFRVYAPGARGKPAAQWPPWVAYDAEWLEEREEFGEGGGLGGFGF